MNFVLSFFQDNSLTILLVSIVGIIISNFLPTLYRTSFLAICLVTLVSSVYLKGSQDEKNQWLIKDAENQKIIAQDKKKRQEITNKYSKQHALNRQLIEENLRLKDINEYLSKEEIDGCVIPPGFVRLHNESAEGNLSGATGKSNGRATEVPRESKQ